MNAATSVVCLMSLVSLMVWICFLLDTVKQEKYLVFFVLFSISRFANKDFTPIATLLGNIFYVHVAYSSFYLKNTTAVVFHKLKLS